MDPELHRGQRCCVGKAAAPQLSHLLPISCGSSAGQVDISGASARCDVDTTLTIIGNDVLVQREPWARWPSGWPPCSGVVLYLGRCITWSAAAQCSSDTHSRAKAATASVVGTPRITRLTSPAGTVASNWAVMRHC